MSFGMMLAYYETPSRSSGLFTIALTRQVGIELYTACSSEIAGLLLCQKV